MRRIVCVVVLWISFGGFCWERVEEGWPGWRVPILRSWLADCTRRCHWSFTASLPTRTGISYATCLSGSGRGQRTIARRAKMICTRSVAPCSRCCGVSRMPKSYHAGVQEEMRLVQDPVGGRRVELSVRGVRVREDSDLVPSLPLKAAPLIANPKLSTFHRTLSSKDLSFDHG